MSARSGEPSRQLYSNQNTPKKLRGTALEPENNSPDQAKNPAVKGSVGTTVSPGCVKLDVMCWNIFDFGSGFNAWTALPLDGYKAEQGEEFENWLNRQLTLDNSAVGRSRGHAADDTPRQRIWSAWLRLGDLARHITKCNAHVTVLLEIMSRPKGGFSETVTCWQRVGWEKAYRIAVEIFEPLQSSSMEKYLQKTDETLRAQSYILDYYLQEKCPNITFGELREIMKDADSVHIRKSQKFWTKQLASAKSDAQSLIKQWKLTGQAGRDAFLAWLEKLDKKTYGNLLALLERARVLDDHDGSSSSSSSKPASSPSSASLIKNKTARASSASSVASPTSSLPSSSAAAHGPSSLSAQPSEDEPRYGIRLLHALNAIFLLRGELDWVFEPAEQVEGETIAICTRSGWIWRKKPEQEITYAKYRPLYRFEVESGAHSAVVYAAHAPAPDHLTSKEKPINSKAWYKAVGKYVRQQREEDEAHALHILCGDFNLDRKNTVAQGVQQHFFLGMTPPLAAHTRQLTSFKNPIGAKKRAKRGAKKGKQADGAVMNCAYDKVLLVGGPKVGTVHVQMMVAPTWSNPEAGRRYSDHAWVKGCFEYYPGSYVGQVKQDWIAVNAPVADEAALSSSCSILSSSSVPVTPEKRANTNSVSPSPGRGRGRGGGRGGRGGRGRGGRGGGTARQADDAVDNPVTSPVRRQTPAKGRAQPSVSREQRANTNSAKTSPGGARGGRGGHGRIAVRQQAGEVVNSPSKPRTVLQSGTRGQSKSRGSPVKNNTGPLRQGRSKVAEKPGPGSGSGPVKAVSENRPSAVPTQTPREARAMNRTRAKAQTQAQTRQGQAKRAASAKRSNTQNNSTDEEAQ